MFHFLQFLVPALCMYTLEVMNGYAGTDYCQITAIGELNLMLWAALAMILAEKLHDFCSNMPNGEAYIQPFPEHRN